MIYSMHTAVMCCLQVYTYLGVLVMPLSLLVGYNTELTCGLYEYYYTSRLLVI